MRYLRREQLFRLGEDSDILDEKAQPAYHDRAKGDIADLIDREDRLYPPVRWPSQVIGA